MNKFQIHYRVHKEQIISHIIYTTNLHHLHCKFKYRFFVVYLNGLDAYNSHPGNVCILCTSQSISGRMIQRWPRLQFTCNVRYVAHE